MSQSVRAPSLAGATRETIDDLDDGLAVSPSFLLERLWHFFISMRTGLALILALAVLGLVGALLAQAPAGMSGDPQAYASWLASVRPKYGGWTGVFDTLGLFSIFSSIWFRGTVVLLTTSILACSVNRAPYLWKQAVHPRVRMSERFFSHAVLNASIAVPVEPAVAADALRGAFRARRFRTVVEADGETIHVYADCHRWGPFGTVMAHLSLVFILAGAIVGTTWGFRDTQFAAPVGSPVAVGNGTGLTLEARSFTDSYYANGSPSDYASDLVLYQGGRQVAAQTIRVNQPLRYGDVTFYQSFFGAAAAMQVKDAAGKVIYDQGVPLTWGSTDGKQVIGQFDLPDQSLTVFVVGAASGEVDPQIKAGQMQLEVYQAANSSTPVAVQVVSQGQPTKLAGLDFTFVRERQFTGLIVARDPGAPLVWGGTLLLVLGVCLVFFFPHRRAWALIRRHPEGSAIQVAALVRHDVTFEAAFGSLISDVKLALVGPGVR